MLPSSCYETRTRLLQAARKKPPKDEEKEIKEATVSPAVASEMGGDAAVVPVLLELDGIFTLREEQRTAL